MLRPKQTPSADDALRFFAVLPSFITTRRKHAETTAVTLAHSKSGLHYVLNICSFQHDGFLNGLGSSFKLRIGTYSSFPRLDLP